MKTMIRTSRARAGFTLIEVLVVLVVLAIVIGFTMTRISAPVDSARKLSDRAEVRNAYVAAQAYYTDNNETYGSSGVLANYIVQQTGAAATTATVTAGAGAAAASAATPAVGQINVWVDTTGRSLHLNKRVNGSASTVYFISDNAGVYSDNI